MELSYFSKLPLVFVSVHGHIVTSGCLLVCCLLVFMWNLWDNAKTLSGSWLYFAWQYQNSQAYQINHYPRMFLVTVRVKQKISSRLKCWTSLFACNLVHYGARSSWAENLCSSNATPRLAHSGVIKWVFGNISAFGAFAFCVLWQWESQEYPTEQNSKPLWSLICL